MLQVPFLKMFVMFVEDRAQDLLDMFSVEAAVQDPCVRLPVQGIYRTSPQKIFVRISKSKIPAKAIYYKSFPSKTSALFTRPRYKISVRSLLARSLYKISKGLCWQDLCKRPLQQDLHSMSLYKVSIRGLLARSLYKISLRGLLSQKLAC